MISLQRFTHHVALWAVLGSALATRDARRRPHPAPASDLLDPSLRVPVRHRDGGTILAGQRRHHTPRHIVGI